MSRYRNVRNWQGIPAALALAICAPAQAEDDPAPAWQGVVADIGEVTPITDYQGLAILFPDSASVRRRLINAYLEVDRTGDALNEAVELVRRGYVFTPGARETFLSFGATPEQRAVLDRQSLVTPVERSEVLATVPAEIHLVESAWTDAAGGVFVTSVVSRGLYVRRGGEGAWRPVPIDGAGSLTGMAFDASSGLLWVASGVFEQTPDPDTAFRGLVAIDPATGAERRRISAPAGASPSDLAIGADGTIYASDPLSGAVYVAAPQARELETLIPPGTFRSPQGIVAFADGSQIVLSDYGYGLALVDVRDGSASRISTELPVLLDGFDGLWPVGDKLVGIQNGARPMRIAELTLSPDRSRVIALTVLEQAHSAWTEPVSGTISDGQLVYVATGQWDRFGERGMPTGPRSPEPTGLRTLDLSGR